jgi:putative transposase
MLFREYLKSFLRLRRRSMFQISRTTPAYYFTSVAHHRLPIFRTDSLKQVICDAYNEARTNHGILILAYVIMLDHVHSLVYSKKEMKEVLRLLNGISARRVIQYLKENSFESSLFKLRGETRERNHKHSVWQHHPDSLEIIGEETFRQKVEYIHMNPVKAAFVENPLDYRYSSSRQWAERAANDEPLLTDHLEINWR